MVSYTESGVLSTGGDLVFGGGMEGNFVALNAKTGRSSVARQSGWTERKRAYQLCSERQAVHHWNRRGRHVRVRAAELVSSICKRSNSSTGPDATSAASQAGLVAQSSLSDIAVLSFQVPGGGRC